RRDVARDLVDGVARRDELAARRCVDAVVARPLRRWTRDAEMDLAGAGVANHLDDLARGRSAHDRVVDDDDALATKDRLDRIQLQAHAEMANRLLRLDERAPHVVGADQPHLERDLPLAGVADRGGDSGVWNGD